MPVVILVGQRVWYTFLGLYSEDIRRIKSAPEHQKSQVLAGCFFLKILVDFFLSFALPLSYVVRALRGWCQVG